LAIKSFKPGTISVAHSCNPSYLGGWDQEDHVFEANLVKVCETLFQPVTGCSGMYLSSHATREAEIRSILVPGQSRQKKFARPCLSGKKPMCGDMHLSS
jgi:hypothetical protein